MRVVAMLSDSRNIVEISRIVGKDEKSSGRWIQSATIRISTEMAIENASPMSMKKAGMGRNSTARMTTMPSAKNTSRAFFATGSGVIVSAMAMFAQAGFNNRNGKRQSGRVSLGAQACAKVGCQENCVIDMSDSDEIECVVYVDEVPVASFLRGSIARPSDAKGSRVQYRNCTGAGVCYIREPLCGNEAET